jgi:hypothetical protein
MSDEYKGYVKSRDKIIAVVKVLTPLVAAAESYTGLLSRKTEGYISAIRIQKEPYQFSGFYLRKWFRTFLGVKDEAMVLFNGEVIREYHEELHKQYYHSRGNEDKYYKGVFGLSCCSVDGLNFEIRKIERVYKNKKVCIPCCSC